MLSITIIFKNLYNTLYFIERASKIDSFIKRNNSSFITKVPRNTASKRRTILYSKSKYTNTYYIYNKKEYKVAKYKIYNNFCNLSYISYV